MKEYWIALNNIPGLGPVRLKKLLNVFRTPQAAFCASAQDVIATGALGANCEKDLNRRVEFLEDAHKQIEHCARNNINILTIGDDDFPSYLKEIFTPPTVLYVKGNMSVFRENAAIAIVGTRNPTTYGKDCTRALTAQLAKNVVITSGLARGIDTIAHECCVNVGGKTIAVLGCGVDNIYPSENEKLAEKICEHGALVSEFPCGTRPDPYNFPRRNRVMSGLSCGVIVVEAGEKSGSLITAKYALEQNRVVFAVPGNINSLMSAGTFKLIKEGAIPIRFAQDVFEHISQTTFTPLISATPQVIKSEAPPAPSLEGEELSVWNALDDNAPRRIDNIAELSGIAIPALLGILLSLELKGFITQIGGQQFKRV